MLHRNRGIVVKYIFTLLVVIAVFSLQKFHPLQYAAVPAAGGNVTFAVSVCPHGLGNCGDNVNPQGGGNQNPKHPSRPITITITNATNQPVNTAQGTVTYDQSLMKFSGSVVDTNLSPGQYLVSLKIDGFLRASVPGFISVTGSQSVTLPEVSLVTGDINNDDQIDILDYNILIGCFGAKMQTSSCTMPPTSQSSGADINDDGMVNGIDYNLFLRELSVQHGIGGGSPTPSPSPTGSITQPISGSHHYLYIFPEGSMVTYDIDNNFSLVSTTSLPTSGNGVRGIAACPSLHTIYVSYGTDGGSGGHLLSYDLVAKTVLWQKTYSHGIDSMAITPDCSKIYMPEGELSSGGKWYVVDAKTGNETGNILDTAVGTNDNGPHNTIVGLSGVHVYMGDRNSAHSGSNYFYVGDTSSNQISKKVGPFQSGIRPFTINGRETLVFTSVTGFLGFQVGDLTTGHVLYTVGIKKPTGATCSNSGATDPSHGISLSPDEKELYDLDYTCNYVHVFDISQIATSAPKQIADIKVHPFNPNQSPCTYDCLGDGWLLHSSSGKYVFVGDSGDIIDTSSRSVVTNLSTLYNSRIFIEIDWQNGVPSFTTTRSGLGYVIH